MKQPARSSNNTPDAPFFVKLPQSRPLLQNAAMGGAMPLSSEGHVYRGSLRDGYWVDAADLTPGYRLLNDDATWAEVVSVEVVDEPLKAYNLTVADYHTYFVAANTDASPIWVHNICDWEPLANHKIWNKGKCCATQSVPVWGYIFRTFAVLPKVSPFGATFSAL